VRHAAGKDQEESGEASAGVAYVHRFAIGSIKTVTNREAITLYTIIAIIRFHY
jgi:hypothetical protein